MRSMARERLENRAKRHRRIRKRVSGSPERPRLAIFRSHHHIYAQIVDDVSRTAITGASTNSPELREALAGKSKTEASREVGKLIAARAAAKGVTLVAFDRGGYRYHGRVKALADGAREGGLKF
jgi:large subunit ribosomal protein L18